MPRAESLERLIEKRIRDLLKDGYAELDPAGKRDVIKLGTDWIKVQRKQSETFGSEFGDDERDN